MLEQERAFLKCWEQGTTKQCLYGKTSSAHFTQTEEPRPTQFRGCTPLHPALCTAFGCVLICFIEEFFKNKHKPFMHHS